jgi:ribosomal protein S18 acetylase RimI-like enzyme
VPGIRPPTIEDADRLGEVHVAAWQAGYRGGLMPDDYLDGLSADGRAQLWRDAIAGGVRARAARLVAEDDDGTVVGFVVCGPSEGDPDSVVGEVYSLNVHPDAWGAGHGGALLKAATTALRDAGYPEAVLWVHRDNVRAQQLYERAGWVRDGQTRNQEVFGITVPEVRYRRPLD